MAGLVVLSHSDEVAMTDKRIREAIAEYRRQLRALDILPVPCQTAEPPGTVTDILGHCHQMLDSMERFLDEGRLEKASRWLGFVQGCLWSCRVYTIDQMKDHNRPDDERLTG
jgi:hypothetical protein